MRISDWSSDVCSSDLRIRESEVAEAELLPFDTGAVDAMSRDRLAVEQQRQAPVIDRLPVDRRRRCARVDDAVESTGGRGRQHNGDWRPRILVSEGKLDVLNGTLTAAAGLVADHPQAARTADQTGKDLSRERK